MKSEKTLVKKQWNFAAESWNDFVEDKKDSGKKIIAPGIIRLLPDKKNNKEKALDLCCGEGYYSRILKDRGYEVSGVDNADNLIEIAQRKNQEISYYCADAAQMEFLPNNFFDLIVCSMGLIDTPDLNGTLAEVKRVLKKDRYFVIAITHPCFDRPMVGNWIRDDQGNKVGFSIDNYSSENPITFKWEMSKLKYPFETQAYHRTLSTYINSLINNSLSIDEILEPSETIDGKIDEEELRVPNFLLIRCKKI